MGQWPLPQAGQRLGAVQQHVEGFEALRQPCALLQPCGGQWVSQQDVIKATVRKETRFGQRGDGDAAPRAAGGQQTAFPLGNHPWDEGILVGTMGITGMWGTLGTKGGTHSVLWVLTWGRRRTPRVRQCSRMRSALRRAVVRSMVSAGVGSVSSRAPNHMATLLETLFEGVPGRLVTTLDLQAGGVCMGGVQVGGVRELAVLEQRYLG